MIQDRELSSNSLVMGVIVKFHRVEEGVLSGCNAMGVILHHGCRWSENPTSGTPRNSTGENEYRTPSDLPTIESLFHLLYYLIWSTSLMYVLIITYLCTIVSPDYLEKKGTLPCILLYIKPCSPNWILQFVNIIYKLFPLLLPIFILGTRWSSYSVLAVFPRKHCIPAHPLPSRN